MSILSIIIPAYNEEGTVGAVVRAVAEVDIGAMRKEIIVVDDGSDDGTAEAAARAGRDAPAGADFTLLRHEKNKGKGAALKTGLAACAGDWVLVQDADLECDPADYPVLLRPVLAGEADAVFGSRILQSANAPRSVFYHYGGIFLSRCFNAFFGTSFTDITGCYKVFPRSVVPALLALPSDGFAFDAVEMPYALSRIGVVKEVPVRYRPRTRTQGKKLHWLDGARDLRAMARIKIFGPDAFL